MDVGVLISIGVVLAAAAALVGVELRRHPCPGTRSADSAALMAGQIEVARLTEECRTLRSRSDQLETEHKAAATEAKAAAAEVARLKERESGLSEKIAGQAMQLAGMQK